MEKQVLGALISATLATVVASTANAYTVPVGSNITGLQLWYEQYNLLTWEQPGYFNNVAFGGFATDSNNDGFVDSANLTFTGEVGFFYSDIQLRMNFDLDHGSFYPGQGIMFTGGTVKVDYYSPTYGWSPYATMDVSTSNLPFLAGQPGHWATEYQNQDTAGVVRNELPGLWDGQPGSEGFNRAVSGFILLGRYTGLYLQGSITPMTLDDPAMRFGPAEVPIPAAAWLFGSGLAGLAGARRSRRRGT